MIKRIEFCGVWFDVDFDYTLGKPAVTYPIDRAEPEQPFSLTISSINHHGDDFQDFMGDWVFNRVRDILIEDVVNSVVGDDDADYKHEMHRDRKLSIV